MLLRFWPLWQTLEIISLEGERVCFNSVVGWRWGCSSELGSLLIAQKQWGRKPWQEHVMVGAACLRVARSWKKAEKFGQHCLQRHIPHHSTSSHQVLPLTDLTAIPQSCWLRSKYLHMDLWETFHFKIKSQVFLFVLSTGWWCHISYYWVGSISTINNSHPLVRDQYWYLNIHGNCRLY